MVVVFVIIRFWLDFYIIKVGGIGEVEDEKVIDCYFVFGKRAEGYERFVVVECFKDFFICKDEVF